MLPREQNEECWPRSGRNRLDYAPASVAKPETHNLSSAGLTSPAIGRGKRKDRAILQPQFPAKRRLALRSRGSTSLSANACIGSTQGVASRVSAQISGFPRSDG